MKTGIRFDKSNIGARFWSKVDVRGPDDCWEWQAGRCGNGYGSFAISHSVSRGAHRMAWALTNGAIPEGMCVCHHCDNRVCCNPNHLFIGTHWDNAIDRVRKGRSNRGEERPLSKLTEADVIEIRIRYRAGGISQIALGDEFGVSQPVIGAIVRGEIWKHLLEGSE